MKVSLAALWRWQSGIPAALLALSGLAGVSVAVAQVALSAQEEHHAHQDCATLLQPVQVQRALRLVKLQLQSQGLKLQLQGCPFVRTGADQMQQVLDVRVWVVDSDIAASFVRGPLADTEPVDMGDVQLAIPASTQGGSARQPDVSPDVLFNRNWLASIMQAQGLQSVHWHWWAFLPMGKR